MNHLSTEDIKTYIETFDKYCKNISALKASKQFQYDQNSKIFKTSPSGLVLKAEIKTLDKLERKLTNTYLIVRKSFSVEKN